MEAFRRILVLVALLVAAAGASSRGSDQIRSVKAILAGRMNVLSRHLTTLDFAQASGKSLSCDPTDHEACDCVAPDVTYKRHCDDRNVAGALDKCDGDAKECAPCPSGYYDITDQFSCSPCKAGQYRDTGIACTNCPRNTFSGAGADSCTKCSAVCQNCWSDFGSSVCVGVTRSPTPRPTTRYPTIAP